MSNLAPTSTLSSPNIQPSPIAIPQSDLDDLKQRLRNTRWPNKEPVTDSDWSQGAPLHAVQQLASYWQNDYDWRRCERLLNSWQPQQTTIDGLRFSFYHIRSPHANALPLLITHGWPGSILEFRHCVPLLTEPTTDGNDAFHVVLPSLPGYGWSEQPAEVGWNAICTASAWTVLMQRLGYGQWVAQGGDWGSEVTTRLAQQAPPGLLAIHLNSVFIDPQHEMPTILPPTQEEKEAAHIRAIYQQHDSGYNLQQSTRPQTLGYALADSATGQLAWIYEKLHAWTDRGQSLDNAGGGAGKAVEAVLDRDEMLDNVTLYWLSNSATSSARYYWENGPIQHSYAIDEVPVCVSQFMHSSVERCPRKWAERYFKRIVYWKELARGGHFAAWEVPDVFVQELRDAFRQFRTQVGAAVAAAAAAAAGDEKKS